MSAIRRRLPSLPDLPTGAEDWRLMGRTARLVLGVPAYALVAVVAAFAGLTLFVTSLNLPLAEFALTGDLTTGRRLRILGGLYPFVGDAYEAPQGALLLFVAGLIGVNVSMALYHFREHAVGVESGGASLVGVLLGTLGAGCAACGVPILLGILSIFGVSSAALVLPLDGLEFAFLAIVALVLSTHWLAAGMRGGEIRGCPVDL
jgi:hypothetical protein